MVEISRLFAPAITAAMVVLVLYPLGQAMAADAVKSMVEAGITSGEVPALATVSFVVTMYQMIVIDVYAVVFLLAFQNVPNSGRAMVFAALFAWFVWPVAIQQIANLAGLPGFQPNWMSIPVLPAKVTAYILGDITYYVGTVGAVLVVTSVSFLKLMEVQVPWYQ